MRVRVPVAVSVVGALAALAAGCGEDREGSVDQSGGSTSTTGTGTTDTRTTPAVGGAPVARIAVRETEYALDPQNPRIARAGVVSFAVKNAGKVLHALEVEGPSGEVETKGIDPGASATLEVDLSKPGKYEWYCPIDDHKGRGMKGTITVAGAGPSAGTGKASGGSGKGSGESGGGAGASGKGGGASGKGGGAPGKRSGGGATSGNGVY